MKNHWLDQAKRRMEEDSQSGVSFDRLRKQGIINDQGEVTGKLHRWTAFLGITAVKRSPGSNQIEAFRCLKPVFGMPGTATIDISRDSMVAYLRDGKKVIGAVRDERLGIWTESCDIRLSPKGFVLCESAEDGSDNVGNIPEFQQSASRL